MTGEALSARTEATSDPKTGRPGDGPAVLGAAATQPDRPRQRTTRRERREARRGRGSAPPGSSAKQGNGSVEGLGGYSDTESVFEAGGNTSTPLVPYVMSLWERRRFMLELARADLRGTQSSTTMGRLWGVLDPLLQAAIFYLLFTVIREGARPTEFLHVLIGGIFLFQLALSAITEGGRSIRNSRNLMLNSTFPRALFPITTVWRGVLKFGPAVPVYAAFHIGLQAPVGWGLLLLPVLFAVQIGLMVGLALLVSTLVVFFKDAGNAVQYIGRVLFFTTPVIYPLASLPDGLRDVLSWQPFFALFACYQVILDGDVPGLGLLVQAPLWAAGILIVGTRVFLRHERELAIRL
jgi:ABC-type polysaccharide/polyol phosphate export permease